MASLLGEYLNTYQRANPAQGLMQGFQTGSNFMFALNQQKMQQEQMKQQQAEREKQDDMKMVSVLFDAAPKMQSKAMRSQTIQRAYDILGKYHENFQGVVVDPNDDTFDEFVSKARRFKKPLVENPDAAIKDLNAFLEEMAIGKDKGDVDEKQYKDVMDTVTGVKKEAAGELGGLALYPEQFRSDPTYQTPEQKSGIRDYQNQILSQITSLGEGPLANQITDNLMKRDQAEKSGEYKTHEPKHRGQDSGEPYVWNPNAINQATGGRGDYSRLGDGKSLSETNESLIPLELRLAPTPVIKEANFTKSAMQRLKNMAKYYKPEYVGIVQGRVADTERKLRELPADQVKFYREFKQFNDDIVRAKEGAVIPDAMMVRLEQFLNDIKQPGANFEAQFDSLTDYTRDQGRNLEESISGQYVSPFKKEQRDFFAGSGTSLLKANKTGAKTWEELKKSKGY